MIFMLQPVGAALRWMPYSINSKTCLWRHYDCFYEAIFSSPLYPLNLTLKKNIQVWDFSFLLSSFPFPCESLNHLVKLILLGLRYSGFAPSLDSFFSLLHVCQYAQEISFSLPMNEQKLFLNEIWKHHEGKSCRQWEYLLQMDSQKTGKSFPVESMNRSEEIPLMSDSVGCTFPNVFCIPGSRTPGVFNQKTPKLQQRSVNKECSGS